MNKIFKKISPAIILTSLLLIVGGFFGASIALAKNEGMRMPMMSNVVSHCANENQEIQKTIPVNDALMPCCIERHDNSGTIVPSVMQERVKFAQSLMAKQVVCASRAVGQKIYPSSPSPPFEAENISSTVKIE